MFEVLFLLAFTLHNIEEGIWLPKWSGHAGKFHKKVSNREFHFALIVITIFGYMVTFTFLSFGQYFGVFTYIYLGFIFMMCLNSIFPHLLATIVLRRYTPGTLTGLLLNLPFGVAIICKNLELGMQLHLILVAGIIESGLIIALLRPLFKLGRLLIDEY